MSVATASRRLAEFLDRHPRLFVLTGAGVSIGSGIPAYRDTNGGWTRPAPVRFRDFLDQPAARQRFWARSMAGWHHFHQATPNACHRALADWESTGQIGLLVTQNVDRLHQRAGSRRTVDLHGRLDRVVCLDCGSRLDRNLMQRMLCDANPGRDDGNSVPGPDGDALTARTDHRDLRVPACPHCGGVLKPDVVFFGETVPRERVEHTVAALLEAPALLVIGSSLAVYSGFRYCRLAAEHGIPMAVVNPGRTRADDLLQLKLEYRFEELLGALPPPDRGPSVVPAPAGG